VSAPSVLPSAVAAVRQRLDGRAPRIAIVLGSGLGALADRIADAVRIPYADIQSGRFHLYEGHAADVAALPARVFAALGVSTFIATNAAGGIRPSFRPGTLMLITDHLNLTGRNPLAGPVVEGEPRFPDMSAAYDPGLRALALEVAAERGIELAQGVYAALLGPSYETPAEIRMLATLGADAVGMSTVPEVIVARARGLRCLGISTITNAAAGVTGVALSHAEVMETAARVGRALGDLVEGIVARA
jgi:purine-nucleoside phosphorylase